MDLDKCFQLVMQRILLIVQMFLLRNQKGCIGVTIDILYLVVKGNIIIVIIRIFIVTCLLLQAYYLLGPEKITQFYKKNVSGLKRASSQIFQHIL